MDDKKNIYKFEIFVLLGVIAFLLLVQAIFVISYLSSNTSKKYTELLNFGYNSAWKNFIYVFEYKLENIYQKEMAARYWQARKYFNDETLRIYNVKTLDNWEENNGKINEGISNSKLTGFIEMKPVWMTTKSNITSSWGERDPHSLNIGGSEGNIHSGIDIGVSTHSEVKAVLDGKVVTSSRKYGNYGKTIILEHPEGYKTLYAHLSILSVTNGQDVKKNQLIGMSGNTGLSTGEHLHFEIQKDGDSLDPMDVWF
jgi:murein DD-endopeptidase MepM/ murein hydrolase activator NlpD